MAPLNWGQNTSPPITPVSPTLNNRNFTQDSYYGRPWNPDLGNERVNNFYKSIARGPNIEFPRFDGNQPLEWIRQIETYFAMASVPDEAKFDLAQMYMVGRADNWIRSIGLLWNPPPWQTFCRMVCDRFA